MPRQRASVRTRTTSSPASAWTGDAWLYPVHAVADDADAIADAQLALADFADRQPRTVFEAYDHAIPISIGGLFDLIAGVCTTERTCDRRSRVAAAASDLVPENAARDAANDGAQPGRARIAVTRPFEGFDHAVFHALRSDRWVGARPVIAIVVRVLRAAREQHPGRGDDQCD